MIDIREIATGLEDLCHSDIKVMYPLHGGYEIVELKYQENLRGLWMRVSPQRREGDLLLA